MLKAISVLLLFLFSVNTGYGQTAEKKHRGHIDSLSRVRQPGPHDTADSRIPPPPPGEPGGVENETLVNIGVIGSVDDTNPVNLAEAMPEFPGGIDSLNRYLAFHIQYPQDEKDAGLEETIYLRFVVETTGIIGRVEVLRGKDRGFIKAAIKCVESMPRWKPGKMGGKLVRVYYNLPIRFRLN